MGERVELDLVVDQRRAEQGEQLFVLQAGVADVARGELRGRIHLAHARAQHRGLDADGGGCRLRGALQPGQGPHGIGDIGIHRQAQADAKRCQYLAQAQRQIVAVDVHFDPHLRVVGAGAGAANGDGRGFDDGCLRLHQAEDAEVVDCHATAAVGDADAGGDQVQRVDLGL